MNIARLGGLTPALVLGALAWSALAATQPAIAQQPKKGGTIVLAVGADPTTLSRNLSSDFSVGPVGCILYQGLTRLTGAGEVKPMLAKSWTVSPDNKTYSFELNKANWQDGKPFTSADVQYSLLEISTKYSSTFSSTGRMIEAIDTPAPDKVTIRLKQPYGPFLQQLSCSQGGAIMPKHVYEGTNPLQNPASTTTPVAMGPFLLSEWKRGQHLRLTRNPDYWEPGKPYLDEVVLKVIPQASARTQALLAGEVDYISYYFLPVNDYEQVKANPKLMTIPSTISPGTDMLFFNVQRKPFDDKRVRQALFMATDRDYLLKTAYLGYGGVGTMPFTNRIPWAVNGDVDYRKMYPFDVAKANALLDEAGLKRGADGIRFKVTMVFSADEPEPPLVSAALKVMWRAVGVDLVNEALDRTSAGKRMFDTRDFDTTMTSYVSFGDPALGIARIFVTSSIGKVFGNPTGYSNPAVDALFEKGEQATDLAERGGHYRQAQAILAQDLPVLTLHERVLYDGIAKSIRGIEEENYLLSWRDAWLAN